MHAKVAPTLGGLYIDATRGRYGSSYLTPAWRGGSSLANTTGIYFNNSAITPTWPHGMRILIWYGFINTRFIYIRLETLWAYLSETTLKTVATCAKSIEQPPLRRLSVTISATVSLLRAVRMAGQPSIRALKAFATSQP